MKALTCEMCGSTNLIKDGGVFVCQSCGTKYSVEEAKKMMVEGTVDVKGTVKIDTSSELQNLYEVARRAKDNDNSEQAEKYYDQILVKDPKSWEATFYTVFFKAMSCKIAEIMSAGTSISNCLDSVFNLVKENVPEDEQVKVISELYTRSLEIATMLFNGAENHYEGIDLQIKDNYTQEYCYNAYAASHIMYDFGDLLEKTFGDKFGTVAAEAWKDGMKLHQRYIKYLNDREGNKQTILQYAEKVKKYDTSYQTPTVDTSSAGACYVATAVYGSYDCPEVWTLRRYRDYTLDETWYGRLFIKSYYAISPTIVKWFGHTEWFKKFWKQRLDKMVANLQNNGVDCTPYQDKY